MTYLYCINHNIHQYPPVLYWPSSYTLKQTHFFLPVSANPRFSPQTPKAHKTAHGYPFDLRSFCSDHHLPSLLEDPEDRQLFSAQDTSSYYVCAAVFFIVMPRSSHSPFFYHTFVSTHASLPPARSFVCCSNNSGLICCLPMIQRVNKSTLVRALLILRRV